MTTPFNPILLRFGGRSYQISPLHLTIQDTEAPKETYRIRDWRLKVCDQLAQHHPDLGKGSLLKQLEATSKTLLEAIKVTHDTLVEWRRVSHSESKIKELEQKLQYYLPVFTRTTMGTSQRAYVCWEVKTSQSIKLVAKLRVIIIGVRATTCKVWLMA